MASVVSPFLAPGPARPLTAALFGLHKTAPSPSPAACLRPFLDSIRTQKHPANPGTLSDTEMPRAKAGRQLTLESGTGALPGCGPSMGSPLSHCPFGLHFPLLLTPSIHIFSPRKGVKERGSPCSPKMHSKCKRRLFFFFNNSAPSPGKCAGIAMFTPASAMLPGRNTTFSQAINLNVELHSLAVFLSLPFDVTSKAKDQRL